MSTLDTKFALFLVALLAASCSESETRLKAENEGPLPFEPLDINALPPMSDPILARGRVIYLDSCARCHRIGKAGAPRTGDTVAWKPRIASGIEQLIKHAIEGYESPSGGEMPERGGNDDLSDEDVRSAVQFMVFLSDTP